uniref:Copper transporter n=1 Tax=Ascaris lumbricoides TaxID=6252 RepID=A0A0M3HUL7_ASCLU
MSLFEGRQPAMFDVKKRIGNIERTTLDEADSAPESWVELAPSRASMCSSVDAIIVDADTAARDYSRQSPISIQSHHVEFEPNLEQVKFRLTRDVLPPARSTDWIWDWSSRPEAIPLRTVRQRSAQLDSTLSTPPNSPEPESASLLEYGKNKSLFRLDIIFGFMVSNIVTFVIGAAIGYVYSELYLQVLCVQEVGSQPKGDLVVEVPTADTYNAVSVNSDAFDAQFLH